MSIAFDQGLVLFTFLAAGTLTVVIGLGLVALYRRAVHRAMHTSAVPAAVLSPLSPAKEALVRPLVPLPPLRLDILSAADLRRAPRAVTSLPNRVAWASGVHVLAGFTHASIATFLLFSFSGMEFGPARTVIATWAKAWPVVLILSLLWGPDRRRQALALAGYLAIGLAFGLWQQALGTPPLPLSISEAKVVDRGASVMVPALFQPLFLWGIHAFPTLFLLVFLNRQVRAVGPLLLAFFTVAVFGTHAGVVLMGTSAGAAAVVNLTHATGIPIEVMFHLVQFIGFAIFAIPAFLVANGIRNLYEQKWISDQSLVFDAIWLLMTLLLVSGLIHQRGLWGWTGLLAFAAYKLVMHLGLSRLADLATRHPPNRLLLLRVFGMTRQAQRLFDLLSARWRYAGPITLIAGPDLATRLIEPGRFMAFLSGRLRRLFIHSTADLDRQLGRIDARPDPDGRFRVNEFFCTTDTWKPAVKRLMAESDLVAMDLRGFSQANRGCIFELRTLLDTVPLSRIALLVDGTTDDSFLKQTLGSAWQRMDSLSPNADGHSSHLRIVEAADNDVAVVHALLSLTAPANQSP